MLPVGPQLVKRSEERGQTKRDPNDPHERKKKSVPCMDEGSPPLEPGLGVMSTDKHLVTGPPTQPGQAQPCGLTTFMKGGGQVQCQVISM